jgi:hypothetical protein
MKIELKGLPEVNEKLTALAEAVPKVAKTRIVAGAVSISKKAQDKCPVGVDGFLRSSIGPQYGRDFLSAEIGPGMVGEHKDKVPYGVFVEFGTGPHTSKEGTEKFVESMLLWGRRKGFDEGIVWAIIQHIRKYGTKPHPFLFPAWEEVRPDFVKKLAEDLNREMGIIWNIPSRLLK